MVLGSRAFAYGPLARLVVNRFFGFCGLATVPNKMAHQPERTVVQRDQSSRRNVGY